MYSTIPAISHVETYSVLLLWCTAVYYLVSVIYTVLYCSVHVLYCTCTVLTVLYTVYSTVHCSMHAHYTYTYSTQLHSIAVFHQICSLEFPKSVPETDLEKSPNLLTDTDTDSNPVHP